MPSSVVWDQQSLLAYIQSKDDVYLSDKATDIITKILSMNEFQRNDENHDQHIRFLQAQLMPGQSDEKVCPRCGAELLLRKNKKTEESFLGCSKFPKCRGTRKLD